MPYDGDQIRSRLDGGGDGVSTFVANCGTAQDEDHISSNSEVSSVAAGLVCRRVSSGSTVLHGNLAGLLHHVDA